MSGSSFGSTIEQVLENLFKVAIAIVVLIVGHLILTLFGGKMVSTTVNAVEAALATKVESAATDVKAHVTTTVASSSPRSSGGSNPSSNRANSIGNALDSVVASTVVAAAENVAARSRVSPTSSSSNEPATSA